MIRQPGYLLATVLALLLALPGAGNAADQTASYETGSNDVVVKATITSPSYINSVPHPISTSKPMRKEHEEPFEPPADKLAAMGVETYDPANPHHVLDRTSPADKSSPLFEPCRSFSGVSNTGWNPPDPDMAVGPDHVVMVVNSSIVIYDKETGEQLMQSTAGYWFQGTDPTPPSSFIFDPKVVYDPNPGHFIIFFLCTDDMARSSFLVSVSKSSDAMGDWYSYNLDATLNGSLETPTWPDYPGLGFDYDQAVYLTANMWQFGGDYLYTKVRILDKAALYSGTLVTWNDIWNLRYHDLSVVFTIKPAVCYSDADGEFLLSNIWYGANYTTYWKIVNPLSAPAAMVRPRVYLSSSYPLPPDAVQPGGPPTIGTMGAMTQEVIYRNGKVYTSFGQSFNWGSGAVGAIRLVGIDTASSTAALDAIFGADGAHYYFPAIYTDPSDRVHAMFCRSSASDFIGIHYVEDFVNDPVSKELRKGENRRTGTSPVRWGDYGGLAGDPDDQNNVWMCHEYVGNSQTSWRTWIGRIPSKINEPSLEAPDDDAPVVTPFTLGWDSGESAASYQLQVDDDTTFMTPLIDTVVSGNSYEVDSLGDLSTYYWRVQGISSCDLKTWSATRSFTICNFLAGDADGNGLVNVADAVFLVDYIFGSGAVPTPIQSGDADCDTVVNISDVIALISYIFGGGPAPCKVC